MCGIVGYIGPRQAAKVILAGLQAVEYRGYDSAGMAVAGEKGIQIIRGAGKLGAIHAKHNFLKLEGGIGLGHTRWATHGMPCEKNAHPQTDCEGKVAVVHNGIIENHRELAGELKARGHKLKSDTDTELVAHLIEENLAHEKDAASAVRAAIARLEGAYSLGILVKGEERLFLARRHAPLIIGVGKKEMFFASDIPALLPYTRDFILLNEGDVAQIEARGAVIWDASGKEVETGAAQAGRSPSTRHLHVDWSAQMAQKGGFEHFMLKEIMEQPEAMARAIAADVSVALPLLTNAKQPAVVACGSSYYAGLAFQLLMHRQGKACAAYIGSEFGAMSTGKEDVLIAISQSGETADTLSAIRQARASQPSTKIIAVTNVVGATLSREADVCLQIGVGPEVGVVATKSFTGQLALLCKLAWTAGNDRASLAELQNAPAVARKILEAQKTKMPKLARSLSKKRDFFFIARGSGYPCALEAALKLKEITYLHAEAYPAGELKHGPLSMLEKGVPVIAIAPSGAMMGKMESNVQECKAREAQVLVMSDDEAMQKEGADSIAMPPVHEALVPLLYILPLQLLAYYMTVQLGKDPDQPRNLAKSVTVE